MAPSFVKMEYTLFQFEVCTYQDIIKKNLVLDLDQVVIYSFI